MATDEERREVARKLREFSQDGMWSEFEDFAMEIGPGKLADLIDPTCHIAYDDWASRQCMGPMLSCDRCGNAFPKINGPYQYCPDCGCRVVSDDG